MMGISWERWRAGIGLLAGAALLAMLGCREGVAGPVDCSTPQPRADGAKRILFVGNSLTYFNQLPDMVRALVDSAGAPPPVVEQAAYPNYALADHWGDGRTHEAVRSACWEYVVLQQGPSSQGDSRVELLGAVRLFAPLIREQGGVPALFSAWPADARRADFARAVESYALAAEAAEGVMLPVASAWLEAWERDPDLQLYADALHPNMQGSYLAALVIVGRLYDVDPRTLPAGLSVRIAARNVAVRMDAATADLLRAAAHDALAAAD
jgi:hypothetical protein